MEQTELINRHLPDGTYCFNDLFKGSAEGARKVQDALAAGTKYAITADEMKVHVKKGTDLMKVMEKVCWVKGPKIFQHLVCFLLFPTLNLSLIPSTNKVSQYSHGPTSNLICWCLFEINEEGLLSCKCPFGIGEI